MKQAISILLASVFVVACAPSRAEPSSARGVSPDESAPAPPDPSVAPIPAASEIAPFTIQGSVVRVNNSICAVSRSRMAPETLGQFVSRVEYEGADPRFRGKVFEFNQCCGGCIQRFPAMWAERPDEILAYHGVAQRAERLQ